jgi:23S rRNA (guanosine2251-2'-O)-methyltransferase
MWITGRRAVAEAIAAGRATEVIIGNWVRRTQGLDAVTRAARRKGLPVRTASKDELDGIGMNHQGVAARVAASPKGISERELGGWEFGPADLVVVLDGITDPQNLGACARVAEAAGAAMLVTRIRRSAGVSHGAIRASAGALLHLPVARVTNLRRSLERLQDGGFTVVGLDGFAPHSIYEEACPDGRVAVVVGSEREGMSRLVRQSCDLLVSIPMRGRVTSLNASAALAAALFGYVLPSRSHQP